MANNAIIDTTVSWVWSWEYTYNSWSLVSDVVITHGLNWKPWLTITDSVGNDITLWVEYIYIDNNNVRIILSTPEIISVKFIL